MQDAKVIHRIIRRIAGWAVVSFFTEVHVVGGENVPEHGPIIVTATHHNMMLDPAVLSCAFPHARILHYWAKASLFKHPVMNYILTSACNIPVDRKSKDRQKLLRGTLEALSKGLAVALFPEGTSYTEPRIMQVKDGAAWAALEYTKWARQSDHPGDPVTVIPTAIVYTNKSKYRSQVIMEFGKPITMDDYVDEFLSEGEGASRAAVKRLTATIERELVEATINAPDWDTLYAARMARDLLWNEERSIDLDEFVPVSQTLVDLFSTPDLVPKFNGIKRHLLTYYSLLQSAHLTNSSLSSLPLPQTLDPKRHAPLPSRLRTLSALSAETISTLIRLPLFAVPLIIHAPAYFVARLGAKMVEDEEETQAQNKVVFGLLLLMLSYTSFGIFVWAMMWYTPIGALLASVCVFVFAWYHNSLVNDNYEHVKRLVAAWRVLVGVWAPKHWDLSLTALAQYTIPKVPPENPWIDRARVRSGSQTPPATPPATPGTSPSATGDKSKKRHPPSRRLIRHVLRARLDAAKALAELFAHLEGSPKDIRVRASSHMAHAYGGTVDSAPAASHSETTEGVGETEEPRGWRSGREVIRFLRNRGAKISQLQQQVSGDWAAALSSEYESEGVADDVIWVPANSKLKAEL